ncbi:MAG: YggS family pyridoxal phosphate-dependent enzyme [Clostridiales bacterium]|nr:YggS family pyridoxal phosphate-dependent enzyme [Clostridiales bacterium]
MEASLLRERYQAARDALQRASEGLYAPPRIIAVTKTHTVQEIWPLFDLGLTAIGENRAQEVMQKWPELREKFQFHCIGRLQTNKVKYIIDKVCMIQSLDRMSLAQEIDRQAQRAGLVMPVLVQISPAGEAQKGGMPPETVRAFLNEVRRMPGLHVEGLMAVMPNTPDRAYLDALFGQMRTLFEQLREEALDGVDMRELSMGMSGDYELAARHGATMVRLGSALLGARDYDVNK